MKTLTLDASGQIFLSWWSEQAISHLRHPLHFERSLAIQIGSFFVVKLADLPQNSSENA